MPRLSPLVVLLVALGCARPDDIGPPPTITAPAEDLAAAATGNNAFTLDLYRKVAAGVEGNAVISPFSVRTALGMTSLGARGATAESFRKVLHFDLPDERLHPALGGLAWSLASGRDKPYEFAAANALWPQSGLALRPEFVAAAKDNYGATVEALDYAGATEAARGRINKWTSDRTRKRVPELLKPGVLGADAALVLTNAVYFKGQWETPFERSATRPADFTLASGEKVRVPMMDRLKVPCAVARSEWAEGGPTWLRLPYRGGRLGMVVGLPAEGQPAPALLAGLTAESLGAVLAGLRPAEIGVGLPKFKFGSDFALLGPLGEMGLAGGDFAGIADGAGPLGAVAHAATVEVNEEGTVAAAATVVVTVKSVMPRGVWVNRPFVFLIHDAQTGAILFCGHVADPR